MQGAWGAVQNTTRNTLIVVYSLLVRILVITTTVTLCIVHHHADFGRVRQSLPGHAALNRTRALDRVGVAVGERDGGGVLLGGVGSARAGRPVRGWQPLLPPRTPSRLQSGGRVAGTSGRVLFHFILRFWNHTLTWRQRWRWMARGS